MARILVIDDDPDVRLTVQKLLEHDGHNVSTAENGRSGLKLIEKENFDLVISDMLMPEQDGFEVIRSLLKQENPPRIIIMSGGTKDISRECLLTMANHMRSNKVLAKPFTLEELREAVNEVL